MNKLDSRPQMKTIELPATSHSDPSTSLRTSFESARRLIVLVPDADSDYTAVTRRVWELASATGARVQFLGLCKEEQEFSLRRVLVTMCAMVQDGKVSAQAKVEIGTDWVDAAKSDCQPGDVIVCFAEQRAGFLHKPLSQILESNLNIPVYIISGLYPRKSKSDWLSQIIVWSGSIGIIIGFCILQVKIILLPEDWFQNVLLILSIIPEFWLIWVWNSLFS